MTVSVSLPSTVTALGDAVTQTQPAITDNPITADFIDPATGDYASMVKGLNPIDAQVILAMSTIRGSGAAVMEDGCNLASIDKIRSTVRREVESEVRFALRRLIQNKDVALVGFEVDPNPTETQVSVQIDYKNLRARTVNAVTLVITH